tara:strand:+ start:1604 stop:1810 length:207 start_codon:yes stop_codon:yes gene_type:complete
MVFDMNEMTPSQKAKTYGLRSLSQVGELTGVSLQTLGNWHKNKSALFHTVCTGAAYELYGIVKGEIDE